MDWKNVVSTVAPWIGTALGGPLGGLAVNAIADALGLDDKTEEAIKTAILGATPEQMLALRQAEQSFMIQMQDLGFKHIEKIEELVVKDRDSARQREMSVRDNSVKWIAGFVVLVWSLINYTVITADIPISNEHMVTRLLGTMDAALMVVLYYYFGGSRGSDRKTELMIDNKK